MEKENNIAITDELIAKYLAGEAGPDEALALHDWLGMPGNQSHFDKLQASWHSTYPSKKPRPLNPYDAWNKISPQRREASLPQSKTTNFYKHYKLALKIAASFLLLAVAGTMVYLQLQEPAAPSPISLSAQNTAREVILPDHSQVTLSRNTRLTYAKDFGNDLREVNLSGEAFFKITPNAEKPFIVHTAIAHIKVVGTSFNAALENGQLEVSVAEGKVLLYTDHDSTYLTPGHSAIVRSTAQTIRVTPSADPNTWGYATQKFAFKDTPLKDVFRCIEKSYPYSIKVDTKTIENCKLTAIFESASVENMLSLIAETLDLTITKNDHTFILQGKGCP